MSRAMGVLGGGVVAVALVLDAAPARSADPPKSDRVVVGSPIGREYLRALGPQATSILAPTTGLIGALVAVPSPAKPEDFGLESVAPGIGRLRASAARIDAFATAHPELRLEIAPPLHPLLDRAGQFVFATVARQTRGANGTGVMIGVADTGLDVTHPEFLDENGKTRVAWMLDLSLKPQGKYPVLESKYAIKDDSGQLTNGQVLASDDINTLLDQIKRGQCNESSGKQCAPSDEVGHGTHVTGIAASTGVGGKYPGIAPKADIVFVRVTRGVGDGIENDDLVRAVNFMFDRANAENKPMVVNLSLGSDFGPHDGSMLWEQAIATRVGPDHPGHIIVAAAGNSGSIVENPIHQSVRVTKGARMRVPVTTRGATAGSVQIWVTPRKGADLQIGLDGPDGEWVSPVDHGHQGAKVTSLYQAEVVYGPSNDPSNQIPPGTSGAIVAWQGNWPTGTYWVTLEGTGMAEMFLQAGGDAGGEDSAAGFANAVREGTINLPATHPAIIGVGCTVNRPNWTSIAGADVALKSPMLDPQGGLPIPDAQGHLAVRNLLEGEVCWFSSAGPTAAGVPKPEIAAPGALVISALSRNAAPGQPSSVFTSGACPQTKSGASDKRCLQIDDTHGIAVGTSMSSPVVAGVVALLLQQDPTLTQDQVLALLQAGAHRYRTSTQFDDEAGPGEVDAMGSLEALDRMKSPTLYLPAASGSWITLSSDYVPADGSTPITAILELRTTDGAHRGDFFDANRLSAVVLVDGQPVPVPAMVRRGPGVWFYEWNPPAGLGGSHATFSANFDGVPIVAAKTLPIGVDRWTALYPSHATGASCSSSPVSSSSSSSSSSFSFPALLSALGLAAVRRKRRENFT